MAWLAISAVVLLGVFLWVLKLRSGLTPEETQFIEEEVRRRGLRPLRQSVETVWLINPGDGQLIEDGLYERDGKPVRLTVVAPLPRPKDGWGRGDFVYEEWEPDSGQPLRGDEA